MANLVSIHQKMRAELVPVGDYKYLLIFRGLSEVPDLRAGDRRVAGRIIYRTSDILGTYSVSEYNTVEPLDQEDRNAFCRWVETEVILNEILRRKLQEKPTIVATTVKKRSKTPEQTHMRGTYTYIGSDGRTYEAEG